MKHVFFVALFLGVASTVQAQTAGPANQLGWNQVGQSPATAGAATYNLYDGASATPLPLTNVICSAGLTDTTCTGSFPALTPGAHTITLTQAIGSAESGKSSPLSFTFVIVVTPSNVTVKDDAAPL
jgi:hypothetical protein